MSNLPVIARARHRARRLSMICLVPLILSCSARASVFNVTTLAGTAGPCGYADLTGSAAQFCSPKGMSVDTAGNIYTVDNFGGTLRKITPAGAVTTLAGLSGFFGSADGTGSAARFSVPSGTAVDSNGNVYVADSGNCTVRKVTQAGVVTTLAGLAGNCAAADGTGSAAHFNGVAGIAVDSSNNIFVTGFGSCTIREITPLGVVTTFAGQDGVCDNVDSTGTAARFNHPSGIAIGTDGTMYVADEAGETIRRVSPLGVVSTLAGLPGVAGSMDGTGSGALFDVPSWTAVDKLGNVYATDYLNDTVREITPGGVVSTLAGLAGVIGSADGTGSAARFYQPDGIAVNSAGVVYVADRNNNTVRELDPLASTPEPGSWVLLLGGAWGVAGYARIVGRRRRAAGALHDFKD